MIYNEEGCRALLCAVIQQAVEDVEAKIDYVNKWKNKDGELYRNSAAEFIRDPFFQELCEQLKAPADKIRTAAFK